MRARLVLAALLTAACTSSGEDGDGGSGHARRVRAANSRAAAALTAPSGERAIGLRRTWEHSIEPTAAPGARDLDAGAVDAGAADARPPDAGRSLAPPSVPDGGGGLSPGVGVTDAGLVDAAAHGEDASPGAVAPAEPLYRFIGDCEGIYVYIVSLSVEDPDESSASLSLSKKGTGHFRQVGDRIDRFEVLAITDDWSGLDPKVWLRDGDEVCRARLLGNQAREAQARKRAAAQRKRSSRRRKKRRRRRRRRRR